MAEQRVIPFVFEGEQTVRVVTKDGEPWFVAADICRVLGISNNRMAVERLDDDEKGVSSTDTLGGNQEMLIVSEAGLYTLIFRSRDAVTPGTPAHRFRRWVTGEVLPQIRRTGRYDLASSRHAMAEDAAKLRQVMAAEKLFGIEAARELWVQLRLPKGKQMEKAHQADLFRAEGETS